MFQFEDFIHLIVNDFLALERYRPSWMVPPYYLTYPISNMIIGIKFYYYDILNLLFFLYLLSRSLGKHSGVSVDNKLNGTQKLNSAIHTSINYFFTRQREEVTRYTTYKDYLYDFDKIYNERSTANLNYVGELEVYLTRRG
jgi:hypothetical protein